jgi:short-subunit dehydrogenase
MTNLPWPTRSSDRRLRDRVVVITGASSGIGRATARAFADEGARLVLAARNDEPLNDTCGECVRRGAHAIAVPTDVSDAAAMIELARRTVEAFGRIDVWINNAGVGLFGPFTHASIDAHRRVVEINLFGAMNGAAAALPYFLEQHSGIFITNISIGGFVPVPFAAAYTAGKFGLRGFMASLRQELVNETDIHVCSIFPAVVDTPGFQHGANVSDAELKPAPPIFPPEKVAAAMVKLALHPRAETSVGWPVPFARLGYGVVPLFTETVMGLVFRTILKRAPRAPRRLGNLVEPSQGLMAPRGGWLRPASPRQRTARTIAVATLVGAGGAIVLARLLRSNGTSGRLQDDGIH